MDQIVSSPNGTTLELHYWFNDNSHTMDAVVLNKCEFELLGVIKEIIAQFDIELTIETEALAEGGLIKYLRMVFEQENKKAAITSAFITALILGVMITPITTTISKSFEILIEKLFEDHEFKDLEKEKIKLEMENLKLDIQLKKEALDRNSKVLKKRSNFYQTLDKYPKMKQISLTIEDSKKNKLSEERIIERSNFQKYILVSDALEPIQIDDAIIEIISPVLKKGDYKWRGIYNGQTVLFNMKSNEFKTLVQTGKIEFKNGSSIKCLLEVKRSLDNDGEEQIEEYNILRVNEYFENDKPTETPEGRIHRQRKEDDRRQLKLDLGEV